MRPLIRKLRRDREGAAAVEFALVIPILLTMIWGMFQVSLLYQANAGVQNALGEAARYATIWPTPSDADITAAIQNTRFGVAGYGAWNTPTISALDTTDSSRTITVSYSQRMNFLFFTGPAITITKSKKVYLSV